MLTDDTNSLAALHARVHALKPRSHVPFSRAPAAALALLGDGRWIPGVRIDSASLSLSLSALANAFTTTVSLGCAEDVIALVLSEAAQPADTSYMAGLPGTPFEAVHDRVFVRPDLLDDDALPAPEAPLSPFVEPEGSVPAAHTARARAIAQRALTPISGFPVGALLETEDERLLPGVNVEHDDWSRILCAERNALGAAYAYGVADELRALYLSCPLDARGTPCGACRQWLVELAPEITLWMDRDHDLPAQSTPRALLPASFSGQAIPRSTL